MKLASGTKLCAEGFRRAGGTPTLLVDFKPKNMPAGIRRYKTRNLPRLSPMKTEIFFRRTHINAPAAQVYAWHARPGALEKLTPPGEHAIVVEKTGGIEKGARVVLQFGRWPFRTRWVAEHGEFEEGRYFTDTQVSGPFKIWKHTHTFVPHGASESFLEDRVEYALPFGMLGRIFAGRYVRKKLERLFEYRHGVTVREFHRPESGD